MLGRRVSTRRLEKWLRRESDPAELLGLSKDTLEFLAWQAKGRLQSGSIDEAERIFGLLLTLQPSVGTFATLGLGACRQARGDLDAAERAYTDVLAYDPGDVHALANRAEVRLLTDRPELACADLIAARAKLSQAAIPDDLRRRVERLDELAKGPR
jgi:Flp pilus assembly protein TadD